MDGWKTFSFPFGLHPIFRCVETVSFRAGTWKIDGIFRFPGSQCQVEFFRGRRGEKKIEDIETWLAFLHLQPACLSESPRSVVNSTNCRHRWALYRSETWKPPKGPTKCWGRDFEETCESIGPYVFFLLRDVL